MEPTMELMMNEQDKMKLNKDHKFFTVDQQMIFQEIVKIESKIMPIIRMSLTRTGRYFRKEKDIMFNLDTREFVILKLVLSKAERSLPALYKKLSDEQYGNIKIVVCFINAEDIETEINSGLGFNVKMYAGEKALDYLFAEDKQEIKELFEKVKKKKIEKLIENMSTVFKISQ